MPTQCFGHARLPFSCALPALLVLTPLHIRPLSQVAGSEEASGCVDGGYGRAALFGSICDAAVDGAGRLLVLDMEGPGGGAVVRVVDPRVRACVRTRLLKRR